MDKEKSATTDNSNGAEKGKQTSVTPKGAFSRRCMNASTVQNVLLIWLDKTIDDESNAITQVRSVFNTMNTFSDADRAIDFLTDVYHEKVFIVISGTLSQQLIPLIHGVSQLDSIFIFCDNKKPHKQWVKDWTKIKGVFTEITPVCEALKEAAEICEHNAVTISFMATNSLDTSNKNLDQLDCSFMYTQILKEILLTIQFEEQHMEEFANYCRDVFAKSEGELIKIRKLELEYCNKTPIWWYTSDCFLYSMLNHALRLMDADIIIKMGFFIRDLHRHIEQLHTEQFGGYQTREVFTVYRGQGLFKSDFDQIVKTKGGLISFNSFLSTSKDRDISLFYAESNQTNPDLVGILFAITINPSLSSTPFASINKVSYFQDQEKEVLFSMHTVFRIHEIKTIGGNNRPWQVDLVLTSDNDEELRILTEYIRKETFPDAPGWYRLGMMLIKMGQPDKAQQVYEVILEQTTDDNEKAPIYHQLGRTKDDQGEYQEAITFYEKTLEIHQKTRPVDHPDLATSYNNIGESYREMGEYSKALSNYEKALGIFQKTLPSNHLCLASSFNNIGMIYGKMNEYSKELSFYEKTLDIRQKTLPPNHPDLASTYNNIGSVYVKMHEYPKALCFFEKALEIKQKSLPANHSSLASPYNNIGTVYGQTGDYLKALQFFEKTLEIYQKTLPPTHPLLASSYNNIGNVYKQMGEYSKALPFLEHALDIAQRSLSANHPHLQTYRRNLADVNKKL